MPEPKIELGDTVKDSITPFKGVVIGITNWVFGCRRMTVAPNKLDKDGAPSGSSSFDEPQLILVKKAVKKTTKVIKKTIKKKTGGPHEPAQRFTNQVTRR